MFYKPYSSSHFTHAEIDAAIAMRTDHGLDHCDIASVELGLPAPVLRSIAEPRDEKIRPQSGHHAKFSGPFAVATALLGGGGLGVYLDDFTDAHAADSERPRLAAAVACVADDACTGIFPHQFPAVLRVVTYRGTTLEVRINAHRGGPQNPLSSEELGVKFSLNPSRALSAADVSGLHNAAQSLPSRPGPLQLPASADQHR